MRLRIGLRYQDKGSEKMGIRAGAICLAGSLALSLNACASVDDEYGDDFDLEFRSGDSADDGAADGGVGEGEEDDGSYGRESDARPDTPGTGGEWLANGLDAPAVGGVNAAFALNTPQGLSETTGILTSAADRSTADYIIECALPEGATLTKVVDGEVLEFEGLLGLAPEWETGACDDDCQQWVTACLLARTNVSQESVLLWIEADHPSIGLGGRPEGLVREASWYGNLFDGSDDQFLCRGAQGGNAAAKRAGRTCSSGNGADDCGFTKYKQCTKDERCTMSGPDGEVPVDCKAGGKNNLSASYHTITTFLPQ